jgi:N-carbamoyl-L-amino-acid hydrolase
VATGRIRLEDAYVLKDQAGLSVKEELGKIGFLGSNPVRAILPHAYVECHIEQGPILKRTGMDLGVVSGVQAISWFEGVILGKSCHAGTTPMGYRRDAGVAAAKLF